MKSINLRAASLLLPALLWLPACNSDGGGDKTPTSRPDFATPLPSNRDLSTTSPPDLSTGPQPDLAQNGNADLSTTPKDAGGANDQGTPSSYPPGPYGNKAGSVIQNSSFQGYFAPDRTSGLATAETYGEVTFDKLRTSGKKYALVQLGAYWCGTCQAAAGKMQAQVATLVPKGGLLMTILTEGTQPSNAATKANLDAWIPKIKSSFSVTLDAVSPMGMEKYFSLGKDSYVVIELATMKIVQIYESDVDGALAKMASLLK